MDSLTIPTKINTINSNIKEIYAGTSYNYCIDDEQQIYSWGLGYNYVLGNLKEDVLYTPYKINVDFFSK